MVQLTVTLMYFTGKNVVLVANSSTFYTRDDRGRKLVVFLVHCAERVSYCQQQLTNRSVSRKRSVFYVRHSFHQYILRRQRSSH